MAVTVVDVAVVDVSVVDVDVVEAVVVVVVGESGNIVLKILVRKLKIPPP